jgi:hypothetical protein
MAKTYCIVKDGDIVNVIVASERFITKYARRNTDVKAIENTDTKVGMVGGLYDEKSDRFIPAKPYKQWVLDEKTLKWKSSKEVPKDNKEYVWDEKLDKWEDIDAYKLKYKNDNTKPDKEDVKIKPK